MGRSREEDARGVDTVLVVDRETDVRPPPLYVVIILNDDVTPMEFVVEVLEKYFKKNNAEAFAIMMAVHKQGRGVVGVFTKEIAATKIRQVTEVARAQEYPLKLTMERE